MGRLRRMTDTEKMMMTGAGGEKVAVGAAVTGTGTVTDTTSLQRKANTELPRRRASTATRAETAAETARGREAARPTKVQRRNLATTKYYFLGHPPPGVHSI